MAAWFAASLAARARKQSPVRCTHPRRTRRTRVGMAPATRSGRWCSYFVLEFRLQCTQLHRRTLVPRGAVEFIAPHLGPEFTAPSCLRMIGCSHWRRQAQRTCCSLPPRRLRIQDPKAAPEQAPAVVMAAWFCMVCGARVAQRTCCCPHAPQGFRPKSCTRAGMAPAVVMAACLWA
jgi:hypothetical protein